METKMETKTERRVVVDLKYSVWSRHQEKRAKLELLPEYVKTVFDKAGKDAPIIVLTGAAPVWLYLKIAHALHGKCSKLIYNSPVTGDVVIFDHRSK